MAPKKTHRLTHLWHRLRTYLAIGVLVFGVVVGLITVLLPFTGLYQRPLEQFLSRQWNRTVKLGQLSGRWRGTGPEFEVSNLVISGDNTVSIDKARLKLNVYKYLWPGGSNGLELVVNSAAMEMAGAAEAQKSAISGKNQNGISPQLVEQLMASGSLLIENLVFKLSPHWQKKFKEVVQHPLQTALQVQQDKNQRAIQLTISGQNLIKKGRLMAVTEKYRQVLKDARWYAEVEDFRLTALENLNPKIHWPASVIDGRLWFTTGHGRLLNGLVLAQLRPDKTASGATQAPDAGHDSLSGDVRLEFSGQPDGKHWQAAIQIQNLKTRNLEQDQVNLLIRRDNQRLQLQADVLDIAMLHNLLVMFGLPGLPENGWRVGGVLRDVAIVHDLKWRRPVSAALAFEKLSLKTPLAEANNLAGEVRLRGDEVRILVASDNGALAIPALLRRPVQWRHLIMVVSADLQADNPDVRISHAWCDCQDLEMEAMARIIQKNGVFLNLASQLKDVQVRKLYKYWPAGVWKPRLISWLDNAFQGGIIPRGGLSYLGDSTRYPFSDHSGQFLARAETRDLVLQYDPDWPKLRDIQADVAFLNRGMQAQVTRAKTTGALVTHGKAEIADFKEGMLKIDVQAHGRDDYLLDFLRASELAQKLPLLKENMHMRGSSEARVHLDLSLKPGRKKPIRPFGAIHLQDVDFSLNEFTLTHLQGKLILQGVVLRLADIAGQFLQNPVTLSGTVAMPQKKPPVVDLQMNGPVSIASLEKVLKHKLPLAGQSQWRFSLSSATPPIPDQSENPDSATETHLAEKSGRRIPGLHFSGQSDMRGVRINLPMPLYKSADSSTPLHFDCDYPCLLNPWQIALATIFQARVRWLTDVSQLLIERLHFGPTAEMDTTIGGNIEVLDLDGWLAVLANRREDKSLFRLPAGEYRFHIKRGIFMSRELRDVDVRLVRQDAAWRIFLQGEDIAGEVLVADDAGQRGIVIQLEKLNWPEISQKKSDFQPPVATGFEMPALHVWVRDFVYQGIPLGEMRLETRPVVGGMKVEKFESRSRWITLNATGDWVRHKAAAQKDTDVADDILGESRFHIVMVSDNLGKFLQSIGYDAPIKGGQTVIEMNVRWPGPPAQFSFEQLNGDLSVSIGPGEVTEAKPGIGRVFGLLNLTNLPRRLILDFADVLSQGLRFEAMTGRFVLRGGQAYTDDFEVLYSGAKIRVKGSMDLVQQTYNQTMTVIPKVGQILPTLGAIAGGPAGAAAGFFMQGILHDSLKKNGKFIYRVTGSWDKPVIELVDVDKARPEELPLDYKQQTLQPEDTQAEPRNNQKKASSPEKEN